MKFHGIIEDLLSSKIKLAVLKLLALYPAKRFSGRELVRLLKASPSAALSALELLRRYGLAHKSRIGKTTEWTFNRRHVLASKLSPVLTLDETSQNGLRQKINAAFSKNRDVIRVVLFGSAAKGKEKPESDIDLFILVKENKDKKNVSLILDKLNEILIPLFGNSISSIIYSSGELKEKKDLALIKHINEEGQIIISHG